MTRRHTAKGPTQRQLRVGEEVRHLCAQYLMRGELHDPALQSRTITVTEVRVSPDLRNGTVFVVPLAGDHEVEILAGLKRAAPHLRGLLAKDMALRTVPALTFEIDRSFNHAQRIGEILNRPDVARDLTGALYETDGLDPTDPSPTPDEPL